MEKEFHEFDEKYLHHARLNHINNDFACMLTAILWSQRSKDPSSQVGACYVNSEGRTISIGYNGAPNNWLDDEFPWLREASEIGMNNTKYPYVIHAEMNGILNYGGMGTDFKDSTLFVTLFPCSNCAKFLVQRGIKKVVYLSDKYKGTEDNIAAKTMLKRSGVECVKYADLSDEEISEMLSVINKISKGNTRKR